MRNILVSFIGTGPLNGSRDYKKAKYFFKDENKIHESSFIASALGEFLDIDTFYLFGTMKSAWEAVYLNYAKEDKDDDYAYKLYESALYSNYHSGLENLLFKDIEILLGNNSKIIPIYYGIDEQQIKDNFEIFSNAFTDLQDGDNVFLDITHSFRSLPLFATTAISFIQDVATKKIALKGIYYGMLEATNEFDGKTPIIDLSYIIKLQDWIKGAYSFSAFGKGEKISELMRAEDKMNADKIQNFSNMLAWNYVHELKSQINELTSLNSKEYSYPAKLIIPIVFSDFTKRFNNRKKQSEYQFELSKWQFEKKMYALSCLCLIESIVTFVCENEKLDDKNKGNREKAKELILHEYNYNSIKEIYEPANEIRKSVAHLIENFSVKSKNSIDNLKNYINKFDLILKKNYAH